MNAPRETEVVAGKVATPPQDIPRCIVKREPDAAYGWFSNRRLQIVKGDITISLSADDLRGLFNFVEANTIEEQI